MICLTYEAQDLRSATGHQLSHGVALVESGEAARPYIYHTEPQMSIAEHYLNAEVNGSYNIMRKK
jgi:hypothetical protein